MKTLSEEQIQEIAESFDMGQTCFWNKETGELVFLPKEEDQHCVDMKLYAEEVKKIKKDKKNFIEIEPPSSRHQFQIMADFAEQLDENNLLRDQLISALNRYKPFQGFKHIIHDSGPYRDKWFAFHNEQLIKFVIDSLKYVLK